MCSFLRHQRQRANIDDTIVRDGRCHDTGNVSQSFDVHHVSRQPASIVCSVVHIRLSEAVVKSATSLMAVYCGELVQRSDQKRLQ